jgi:flagellar motor switch protein FliM
MALESLSPRMASARPAAAALRPLDLTGRERHLRNALGTMSRIAVRFCRSARRTLPFLVRRKARLLPESASIAGFSSLTGAALAAGPTFEVLLEAEGAWGSVLLNSDAVALVLDGALGGGDDGPSTPGGELTLAQKALIGRIARALAEDFVSAVRDESTIEMTFGSMRGIPAGETREPPGADGLSVECRIDGIPGGAAIEIRIAAAALESAARANETQDPMVGDPRLMEALHNVPLELTAELGTVTLGLRSVLSLRVGQILRLSTAVDDPVVVRISGQTKFSGVPVISRGQLSVEIRGRHGE